MKRTTSNKTLTILNTTTSLLYEVVVMVYGFIVPRLILGTFGSSTNGLVSSVGQFLNLITILDGGVSGVVRASLYKPLAEGDHEKVSAIYNAAASFYRKIALVYAAYSLTIACFYPLIFKVDFSWKFSFALISIISVQGFIQYFFSINLRTLICADRRGYFVSLVSVGMQIITLVLTVLVVKLYPDVLLLKAVGIVSYTLQPILYGIYVKKHYRLEKTSHGDDTLLKQRWDGFGQNLAYFIHSNTDIVLLTVLGTWLDVSVYSVYSMIVAALRKIVLSVTSAITPTMGNILVTGDHDKKNRAFDVCLFVSNNITTLLFACGFILITPFVSVYTSSITDANYHQPFLGYFLVLAEAVYCYRTPYVEVAYSAGHFRQTTGYAFTEAGINIVLSIALFFAFGISGVALATFSAMVYRYICHVVYLKNNILLRKYKAACLDLLCYGGTIALSFLISKGIPMSVTNYGEWFAFAVIIGFLVLSVQICLVLLLKRAECRQFFRMIFSRK